MTTLPRYLEHARFANQRGTSHRPQSERERSEKSEKSLQRFVPGGRYRIRGPVIGIIHRTDSAFDEWREEMRLPRAGIMTIEGTRVVVADVRAALRSGYVDVVGVYEGTVE